jgi:hypothetical protein
VPCGLSHPAVATIDGIAETVHMATAAYRPAREDHV